MISSGCTCKNSFTVPFSASDVETLFITYQQNGKNVFEKTKDDCIFDEGKICVELGQEDTLKLNAKYNVLIQIRAKLTNGVLTKSNVVNTVTDTVLKTEVI